MGFGVFGWPIYQHLDIVHLFGRSFVGYLWVWAEDVLLWRSENVFEAWELFWSTLRSLRTFECHCLCYFEGFRARLSRADSEVASVVFLSFSQPYCWFLQLLSFSPPINLFGPQTLTSFVHISETRWAWPYRVWRQSPWIFVVFVWCGSGPVLCCFAVFSAGETQIWPGDLRVVAVAVFFLVVLGFPWCASFMKPKCFI